MKKRTVTEAEGDISQSIHGDGAGMIDSETRNVKLDIQNPNMLVQLVTDAKVVPDLKF